MPKEAKPKKIRVPTYRRHSSGQARVTINGRDHLLGPYGSAVSRESYRRLVAEWVAGPERFAAGTAPEKDLLSVNELILAYWTYAVGYYGFDGRRGDEACLRDAMRVVKKLYGNASAAAFGPLALKTCRNEMLAKDWSRTYTNAQVDRVRRMFRWAVAEQLLPPSSWQALAAVPSLRKGKGVARETQKVRPVPAEHVEAARPHMPAAVRAMVDFQLLTACRPAEVCMLRPMDLDMKNPACWVYRPQRHKTEHVGQERMIFVGTRAQEVLRPYLGVRLDAYCFAPADSERRRNADRRAARQTKLWPAHVRFQSRKKRKRRQRAPGDCYDTHAYRRAIARACCKGGVPAWGPNRLRHHRATELRAQAGIELAKTVLGHTKLETTQIYAERDLDAAMELMARIG